jgi:Copper type II ascorbate-dependent monooxygenase, C-terminal domain
MRRASFWLVCSCALAVVAGCGSANSKSGAAMGGAPSDLPNVGTAGAGSFGSGSGPGSVTTGPGATSVPAADGVPCNVATVVSNNCTLCHASKPSFGAPMALMTYADFHAAAKSDPTKKVYELIPVRIKTTDTTKRMPPVSRPALLPADLQALDGWATAGAMPSATGTPPTNQMTTGPGMGAAGAAGMTTVPSGTTAGPGGSSTTPIQYNDPLMKCYQLKAHDPSNISAPFSVSTQPDMYTNFSFTAPWTGMQYARSFHVMTDNLQVIHHWLLYKGMAGADGSVAASPGAHPGGELVHGWAPGGNDLYLSPDTGEEMPGGDMGGGFTLETHHNNGTGAPAPDSSGVEVCVTPTMPTNIASISWLGTDAISGTMATGVCTPTYNGPIHIIGGTPHMHIKGTRQTVIITRANGMTETLHDQPFDFNYQRSYPDSTIINPGDSLATTCYWNAPAAFGETTTSEMCYYFTLYYPKLSLTNGNPVGALIHGNNTCL